VLSVTSDFIANEHIESYGKTTKQTQRHTCSHIYTNRLMFSIKKPVV